MSNSGSSFFTNKVAVITGAGGTLCSAIAHELAQQGARVALLGRTAASLERAAQGIRAAGGTALVVPCDVTNREEVEQARSAISRELGECHLLINGAGGNQPDAVTTLTEFAASELTNHRTPGERGFFDLDLARFEDVVRVNTLGTVIPSQVFGREMAQLGRGSILNFASMNSYRPLTRVPAYAMAKAGIVNFTQWLAVYLAPAGVRVNAVAPGFFVNERSQKILMKPEGGLTARGQSVMAHTALKRFGEAHDLLGAVCWLLDDQRAAFVTGITVSVDGGFLASSGV
ncbi:MAG: SDR family oxidoreductase [Opitutae bacterium]|jgi:NAD(P)-dependent dehydrogenase (short-subunit alcohol dehydrogenase family)|nr:SDR family oxidoreductase [Opitutae bacterium]